MPIEPSGRPARIRTGEIYLAAARPRSPQSGCPFPAALDGPKEEIAVRRIMKSALTLAAAVSTAGALAMAAGPAAPTLVANMVAE